MTPDRRRRLLLAALIAGAAVAGAALALRGAPRAPARPGAPGVVVFCFDTLRRDAALGANDGVPRMPALSAFAAEAADHVDAVSSSAWTAPSVATLLTGLLPSAHGVDGESKPLTSAVTTVAERLRDRGWSTAAFTGGGWLVAETGFAQGFDVFQGSFDEAPPDGGPEHLLGRWKQARPADRPFFLFVHTYAPHDPYGGEEKARARAGETSEELMDFAASLLSRLDRGETTLPDDLRKRFLLATVLDGRARRSFGQVLGARGWPILRQSLQWLDGGLPNDPEREQVFSRMRDAYLAGLSHADDVFRRTRRALADLPEGTAWVVVSDHGEAFGEHGTAMHGRWLWDEFVRVPLLVRAPGRTEPGPRRGGCGVVDVAATVLDLAGDEGFGEGRGRSLLAPGPGADTPVLGEEVREEVVGAGLAGTAQLTVRTPRAKLVVDVLPRAKEVREALFDLAADPGEARALPAAGLERYGAAFVEAAARVRAAAAARLRTPDARLPR